MVPLFSPLALLAPLLSPLWPTLLLLFHLAGPVPDSLGPVAGGLAPCDGPAHCVRQDWPLVDPAAAMARLAPRLEETPGLRIERFDAEAPAPYLHATASSRFFGFVDDLELQADPDRGLLQVRSASRLGDSDLGVNLRRVEGLRRALVDGATPVVQGQP
jgi:uncharacterized protein (DUF1499 family)